MQLFLNIYQHQPMQLFLNIFQYSKFSTSTQAIISHHLPISTQTIISYHLPTSTYTVISQYLFNIKKISIGLEKVIIFKYYLIFFNIKKFISSFFNFNFNINIVIYYNIHNLRVVFLTCYDKMTKHWLNYFLNIYSHIFC